jgi:hypothetical protein
MVPVVHAEAVGRNTEHQARGGVGDE